MRFVSAVWKELLEVSHDRTMLLVLIAFPIFIMLFMGSSFRSMEISGLSIGVVGPQDTPFSSMLLQGLNDSKAFKLQSFDSESVAMDEFKNGQLKAVIIIPQDFEETLKKGNGSKIAIVVDNSDLALEQSVLAALSAVVQASSADITKAYVTGAWSELHALNDSAGELGKEMTDSRDKMVQTKLNLEAIKKNMEETNLSSLEESLDRSSASMSLLQSLLDDQRSAVQAGSEANIKLLDNTTFFVQNASYALDEAINSVQDSHGKLLHQIDELENTAADLQASIDGLKTIKATVSDPVTVAALEYNIQGLTSLKSSTLSQIQDAKNETKKLETLNATLQEFRLSLLDYSIQLGAAKAHANDSGMLSALDNASVRLLAINASFASAKADISKLKATMDGVRDTMSDIDGTLDKALNQTEKVDDLITTLQDTVTEQTARDPDMIAAPLSIDLRDQYVRVSYVDFLMPQVIAISLLFSCFLLCSISLVREKTRNTIVRALLTPYGLLNMVLGKVLSLVLLSMGQITLILAVALLIFGVKPPSDIGMLLFGTIVSSLVLSSVGVLIGFYARTESAAIQTCLLIAIPMLFLGNIIFSPDLLPAYTQILQQLLPLAHVTNIFKVVLITGGNPAIDMVALLTYFVLLAIVLAFILIKRKDISNYY